MEQVLMKDKLVRSERVSRQKEKPEIPATGYVEHAGFAGFLHNLKIDFIRNKVIYIMCIPIVVWYIIFHYIPMAGIVMAFQKYTPALGISGSPWVGFDNFVRFFTGPYFGRLLRNTAMIGILDVLFGFPAPIIFALLLNEVRTKVFKKTIQTVSYMPYFISMVVVCGLIVDFTQSGGLISNVVAKLSGTTVQNLLADPKNYWAIHILSNIWQGMGYGSIIYIAALSGVDQQLYEAAVLDGASRWQRCIHITIPSIMPTIMIMLILRMGSLLQVGADKILLLYTPATYETADVISTYIYRCGLQQYDYGFSTAVGLFNSIIGTTFLLVTNAISKKYTESSLF
ncbi:ABC transporter permease [Butyrivibrio sp. AC2005]|uniref:ABC transporter permease n=1 Tax=Butyrivibrio sp. AC2005 TaxID=1280672 RepID=UPI000400E033|nr:ABC transporter permease subunit [Butyrivibrio sp. AC2005]